jgi:hypothetical protein
LAAGNDSHCNCGASLVCLGNFLGNSAGVQTQKNNLFDGIQVLKVLAALAALFVIPVNLKASLEQITLNPRVYRG